MLLLKTAYNILNNRNYEFIKDGEIDLDDHCLGIQGSYIIYFKMPNLYDYVRKNICSIASGTIVDNSLDFTVGCSGEIGNKFGNKIILLHKTKDLDEIVDIVKQLHFLSNSYCDFKRMGYNNKKMQVKIGKNYLKSTSGNDMYKMIKKTKLLSVLETFKQTTELTKFIIRTEKSKRQYVQINFFLYSLLKDSIEIVNV